MNSYTQEYTVGENFHLRQIARVQNVLIEIESENEGLIIKIDDYINEEISFMKLTMGLFNHAYKERDNVEITIEGDLEKEILKKYVNKVGVAFEFNFERELQKQNSR